MKDVAAEAGVALGTVSKVFNDLPVRPVGQIARTAVDLLLSPDRASLPALVCLPVSYRPGGTTKDGR